MDTYIDVISSLCRYVIGSDQWDHPAPYVYLEMGVESGQTFNAVAPGFHEAHAVDIDSSVGERIKTPDATTCVFHNETTDSFTRRLGLGDLGVYFDAVFIDAWHAFDQVMRDFAGVLPHVREGGLIFLHDTCPPTPAHVHPHHCNDAYRAPEAIRDTYPACELLTLPPGCGLTIVRKAPAGSKYAARRV
ncbi:MAG: hypothetical protein HN396_15545 [Gemmatimonadales bacterium]|jgi:hypothetical protein|nr:hypothetical protein [Gemmatimonadales bacterium]